MFASEQLSRIDPKYFKIICRDEYDIIIISKNTGHIWNLHCSKDLSDHSIVIFHKHHKWLPYHGHGRTTSLRQAIKQIREHDAWQMAGRPERSV